MQDRAHGTAPEGAEDFTEKILEKSKEVWEAHGRLIVGAVVALLVIVVAQRIYSGKVERDQARSWEALSKLPDLQYMAFLQEKQADAERRRVRERCQTIVDAHWKTDATPWVLLKLAGADYELGKMKEAETGYRRVMEQCSAHPAAEMARAALAAVLETVGRHDDAAALYIELATGEGNADRLLDAARNLELAGNMEEAKKHYRALLAAAEDVAALAPRLAAYRLAQIEMGRRLNVPRRPQLPGPELAPAPEVESAPTGEVGGAVEPVATQESEALQDKKGEKPGKSE